MKQVKTALPLDAEEQAERIEREVRAAGPALRSHPPT